MIDVGLEDRAVLDTFPDAPIDHDNIAFYRGLLQRRFLVHRCDRCGHRHTPLRSVCPQCWSRELTPTPITGRGVIYMLVGLHEGQHPEATPGEPVVVATVELEEQLGLRVSAPLIGCAGDVPHIGMEVQLCWTERAGAPSPVFRPMVGGTP